MTLVETSNLAGAALAIRHGNTSWTDERVVTVRRLWADGLSASQISVELGGATRNAVIGKLHRLGLMRNDRTRRPTIARTPKSPQLRNATKIRAKLAQTDPGMSDYVPAAAPVAANPIFSLFELEPTHCRWPLGEPEQPGFHYCGGQALDGRSYCRSHHRIAYRPKE
jgi:GcrA cell cycle regulator